MGTGCRRAWSWHPGATIIGCLPDEQVGKRTEQAAGVCPRTLADKPPVPPVVVRVRPTGDDVNDGSSWGLAKRTVQAGIDAASGMGGEVWVQAGTYEECITLQPYAYVYGGFAGGETVREERDWDANGTTLDGQEEGSVVTGRAGGHRLSAIDGFTITNGRKSGSGGGVYLYRCDPTIANNKITSNRALNWGGGLYLLWSSPMITNNTITGNRSERHDGGGLCLEYSDATIADNTSSGNSSYDGSGGGLYLYESLATVVRNTIIGNWSHDHGGGLYLDDSDAKVVQNTIAGNTAFYDGGGVYLERSDPLITHNTITGNTAGDDGGGIHLYCCQGTIADNTIIANRSDGAGGGLSVDRSAPIIVNNSITGNNAYRRGGGFYMSDHSSGTIANNTITGNSPFGLVLHGSSPVIADNSIIGNNGFGLSLSRSSPVIVNNTIAGNTADTHAGGLLVYDYSWPTIANTIIAFNSSGIYRHGGTLSLGYNCVYGNTEYDYFGLSDPTGSDGNISGDPLFVRNPDDGGDGWGDDPMTPDVDEGANDDFGDVQLLSGSPAIDAGDNDAVPADTLDMDGDGDIDEPMPFDLGGWARFVDDPDTLDSGEPGELGPPVVDMGAYEFRPTVIVPLDIMPARCPNRWPVKAQGMIWIALVGTDLLDVSNVELDSLLLTRADGVGGSIGPQLTPMGLAPKVRDVATPFEGELCDCQRYGRDGVDDLLLVFSGGKLVRALQLESVADEMAIELTLSGTLGDGTWFEASDCVQIAHPGSAVAPKRNGRVWRR